MGFFLPSVCGGAGERILHRHANAEFKKMYVFYEVNNAHARGTSLVLQQTRLFASWTLALSEGMNFMEFFRKLLFRLLHFQAAPKKVPSLIIDV